MLKEFFAEYGASLLYAVVTAVFGYLGIAAKKAADKFFAGKEKRETARLCVEFTEQVYTELHGKEKLKKAMETASNLLCKSGISCSEEELLVLLEAAVAEFNRNSGLSESV